MGNSTVSVVMCTYNGEKYLREQMDSILAQTYPIYEIIVRDDRSTDTTLDILQEYAARHSHIKVFQNEKNLGFNANFYAALQQATGDYIAISDQDDIWFPEKIEKQIQQIEKGNYVLCFSESITTQSYQETQVKNYQTRPYTAESLFFFNTISGHAMLFKRTFVQRIGTCEKMSFFYDWWLAINAALEDSIVKCNQPLVWHRSHFHSVTQSTGRDVANNRKHSAIAPYIFGISHFLKIRKSKSWIFFYINIYQKTSYTHHPILHKITKNLLSKNPLQLIKACFLFMKYRNETYPPLSKHGQKGLVFAFRSFFSPFLFFYYNRDFNR